MSFRIRTARAADRPAIEAVVHAAYAPYVPRIGREPAPMHDDYAVLIAAGHVHVIEHRGAVKGVLVLVPQADMLLLDNIAVSPDSQGLGLGRRLLEFAETTARNSGFRHIGLYTNEAMTENIALYARIGYAETHRGEEHGFRRVYMRKQLA